MPFATRLLIAAGLGLAWLAVLFAADRRLVRPGRRAAFRCAAGAATFALGLAGVQRLGMGSVIGLEWAKGAIAAVAVACLAYERHRRAARRPVPERTARAVGTALAAAAVAAYFAGLGYSYRTAFHVWDQYHYVVGSRYFAELGYDGLYRCAAVAQAELPPAAYPDPLTGRAAPADPAAEVRLPGRMIRNLGVDNTLVPAGRLLAEPELCRGRFSAARWEAFRADVAFFRMAAGAYDWSLMQRDHGYNPPPVWTMVGGTIASLRPVSAGWLRVLALLDVALLAGAFAALAWAFGWRVAAVGAVFWGTQAFAPFFWTGGAFLRQDWLFWLVLSACLARKRRWELAGASLAFASLLRVFPALAAAGWAVQALWQLARTGRLAAEHRRLLVGGLAAVAVLVPASMAVAGRDSYAQFARHIAVHDRTPLTNHVGLRVLLSHGLGAGPESGRLKYVLEPEAPDPHAAWKEMRAARWETMRPAAWMIVAVTLAWFARIVVRIRRPWIALGISQLWIVLLAQLTCYYYVFLLLTAPLTKARRSLEIPFVALSALSQAAWGAFWWNDDRYAALSVLAVGFCYAVAAAFFRGRRRARESIRLPRPAVGAVAAPART